MEVQLVVPHGTDVSVITKEYSDLSEEDGYEDDEFQIYWIGNSMGEDEYNEWEWLTHDDAIEFCGFCEGAIDAAETLIEGNGGWAQGMISRKDFSNFAMCESEKKERKRISDIYWASHKKGKEAAAREDQP